MGPCSAHCLLEHPSCGVCLQSLTGNESLQDASLLYCKSPPLPKDSGTTFRQNFIFAQQACCAVCLT